MTLFLRILLIVCLTPAAAVQAQDPTRFPEKPMRIVVGFSPGGLPDLSARLIGQKLAESWKQQVVVDNRAGAGGIIAAQTVATANPDGYTLLSVSSAHAAGPAIYAKLPYDTVRDLSGVSLTASTPSVLVATPALGAKTVKDLVTLARAKPGQILFSSAGIGSATHFSMEMLKTMAGIDLSHVPYKGIPEALTEAMVGRVQLFLSPLINAVPLIKDGKVSALGITTTERHALLPEVPTIAESGLPGYRWEIWYGLLAPGKTPRPIVARLNREVVRILALPDVRSRWQPLGVEPKSTTPEQFDALVAEQITTFTRLARAANIKAE
jgi:tripartite-type tricarboxylate transporter receptor subunit TctC